MPVIDITMGPLTPEKKKALIEKLTAAAIEVTQIPASEFTMFVHELSYDNIGRGGKSLSEIRAAKS
jgi:4-oxalocrotonate tautomerase